MKSLYIHHHMGLGDHICLNGLVWNLFNDQYDKTYLFCKEKYYSNLRHLYEKTNVELIPIGSVGSEISIVNDLVKNMSKEKDDFVRIGFCNIPENKPCDVYFYEMAGVPYKERFDGFRLNRNIQEEKKVFDKLNPTGEDYIFIHDDSARGFIINVETNYKIIKNDISESIFHYGMIIEKAKEFHCVESCMRCYTESLNTDEVKLFYHDSVRPGNVLSTRKEWVIL